MPAVKECRTPARAAGQIHHHADRVCRAARHGRSGSGPSVADRLGEGLAEGDAHVFHG